MQEKIKDKLVNKSISARNLAITFRTKVGAAILAEDNSVFPGFNIETYIHKGYHAEEVALIGALSSGYSKKKIKAIAICYDMEDKYYPGCASCRQFLWEFTHPDLLIIVCNSKGKILGENYLKEVYPYPYPGFSGKKDRRTGL